MPFTAGGLIKATVIGAFSAAVTYGIGEATAVIPQLGTRIAVEAVAHGLFQGVMAGVQGGDFWQGFASGALASVAASLYGGGDMAGGDGHWGGLGGKFGATGAGQIAFGTISGGAGAALTGGNFWQGAATGFVVSALNHVAHKKEDKKFTFKKGKSPFEIKEYSWIGGGEFVEAGYGKLVIKPLLGSSSGFEGQAIESGGFSLGVGLGSPVEVVAATRGVIYFDRPTSGNNLLELFQETKFIRVVSTSAVVKHTRIEAYTNVNMNVKLWHADMFGFGVVTMGIQSHRYPVNFQNK